MRHEFFIEQIEDQAERDNARRKLAQVIEFCELQTCRRGHLLEYFGEEWTVANCGGCDVCTAPREEFDATEIAQKVLSTVIRTGERFGVRHIVDVLRGASTKKIRLSGHDQLMVFGIAGDSLAEDLIHSIDALLGKGLLVKNGTSYPTLAVTGQGRDFLKGHHTLTLHRPKRSVEDAPSSPIEDLSFDSGLFEKLRVLRKRFADERGVPAYVIFGDTVLRQMASYLPRSLESFSRISGVGTAKLEEFSKPFLELINHYANTNGLVERAVPTERSNKKPVKPQQGPTLNATKELVFQKLPVSDIAKSRGFTERTIIDHISRLVLAGEELDLDYLMPSPDRMAKIEGAFKQTGGLQLTPVKEMLGEQYSYEELKLVRLGLAQKGWGNGQEPQQQPVARSH